MIGSREAGKGQNLEMVFRLLKVAKGITQFDGLVGVRAQYKGSTLLVAPGVRFA